MQALYSVLVIEIHRHMNTLGKRFTDTQKILWMETNIWFKRGYQESLWLPYEAMLGTKYTKMKSIPQTDQSGHWFPLAISFFRHREIITIFLSTHEDLMICIPVMLEVTYGVLVSL